MKIVVLLGSPCGKNSATLQYVTYLVHHFPHVDFEIHDVGRGVHRFERDPQRLAEVFSALGGADGILWSFPVYTFLAPAPLVRFIEILHEHLPAGLLEGKMATTLTTSEHFFDHTAHTYIEAVSEDLGMKVMKGFSAAMKDLLSDEGQRNLRAFAAHFFRAIDHKEPAVTQFIPITWVPPKYTPDLDLYPPVSVSGRRRVTLVTDHRSGDTNLGGMIDTFCHFSPNPVDVLNLHSINMKGGCLGCMQCVYDGTCVYRDGFAEAFDKRIRSADVLIFAGTIGQRYLSSTFKTYFDRNFRNGHRPVLHGKPMGWLISGPLRHTPNLRQILEAKGEVQRSPRLGIVTDEGGDAATVTAHIRQMVSTIDSLHETPFIRPATFLGEGGRKIFRDLMYAMRGVMRADHHYYRREGLYDFPQKGLRQNMFNWAMTVAMEVPWSRRWVLKNMGEFKRMQYDKTVSSENP